jgi:3-oxoacyl-[acyl-carrier protein] reductase
VSVVIDTALRGRCALVTGGASGIGRAAVEQLARSGASVALAYNPDHAYDGKAEAAALRDDGLDVRAYVVDVASDESVAGLHDDVARDMGPLDVVLANAGIATRTPIDGADLNTWSEVIDVNLTGAYRTLAPAIPSMRERRFGRLMVTASVSGAVVGWPEHAAYCASKAGLVGLVRGLAVELAPFGITANAIAPGLIRTPQSLDPVHGLGAERLAEAGQATPAGRSGEPAEIAAGFAFLASEAAAYVNGQVLVIDGAATLVEAV